VFIEVREGYKRPWWGQVEAERVSSFQVGREEPGDSPPPILHEGEGRGWSLGHVRVV
jgi:hypothetical protein